MNGLLPMLRKEALEVRSTKRKWVLPAVVASCAVLAPVITYYAPQAAKSGGIDATATGASSVFLSLLSSLVILAIVTATSGIVGSEVRGGTAVLVLTKPVSRTAFVLAKIIAQGAVVIAACIIGTAVFAGLAYGVFGSLPLSPLLGGVGLWLALALLYTAAMVVLSSRIGSQSALGGIGIYIVFSLFTLSAPLQQHTPAGIGAAAEGLVRANGTAWAWPLITTLVIAALLVTASGRIFARREI